MRWCAGVVAVVVAALASPAPISVAVSVGAAGEPLPHRAMVRDRPDAAPPGVDLVSGTYRVTRDRFTWRAEVDGLDERTFVAFELHVPLAAWDRVAVYRERGRTVAKVYFVDTEVDGPGPPYVTQRPCPGLSTSWSSRTGVVSASVPDRCLQAASRLTSPYVFETFTRVGGVVDPPRDSLPVARLAYPGCDRTCPGRFS